MAARPDSITVAFAHDRHIGANEARKTLEDTSEATPVRLANGEMITLGMIADGMGGIQGGEVASRTAVNSVLEALQNGDPSDLPALLQSALMSAQRHVQDKRDLIGFSSMGTTATVTLITPNGQLYLAHVGDSRAYLIRNTEITQLTLDHAWGDEQVREGKMTRQEAAVHDRRDALNRYLGQNKPLTVDMGIWLHGGQESQAEAEARQGLGLQPGDTLLVCSDGLIKEKPHSADHFVEPQEIVQIVGSRTPNDAARELVNLALARNVDDNVSVVILHIQAQGASSAKPTVAPGLDDELSFSDVMRELTGDADLTYEEIVSSEPPPLSPVDPPPPPPPAPLPDPEPVVHTRPASESEPATASGGRRPTRKLGRGISAIFSVFLLLIAVVIFVAFVLPSLTPESSVTPSGESPTSTGTGIVVARLTGSARYSLGGDYVPLVSGEMLPADRHIVINIDAGSQVRLKLEADNVTIYAGDELTELWLTPNADDEQANAPATMVRLITGRVLVAAGASQTGGFILYSPNEKPWVTLTGTTMGARRIVDRGAGIEEITIECLDGICELLTPEPVSVAPCQRVKIASSEVIPPASITSNNWAVLAGADVPPSLLCGS